MIFRGTLGPPFEAFVRARSARLSLALEIHCNEATATLVVTGPEALVGALEMAACVAPDECLVEDWAVTFVEGGAEADR